MTAGLEKVTIEAIADIAGVSSMTVHNYYGTKSGMLLALVAENDRELLTALNEAFRTPAKNLVDLVERFFAITCEHTQTHLDKAVWRQVISASVCDAEQRFGKLYQELDDKLTAVLIREITALQATGWVAQTVDPAHLGRALFNLQNSRFIEFIASDGLTASDSLQRLRNDLNALFPADERNRAVS